MAADDRKPAKVRLDEFTAKAVPDPKNPEASLVTGFVGVSSEPGKTRIYWDPSLSSYVDVDTADILHSEPVPKEQSGLGGSYIWLKRSAEVSYGSAGGQTAKGKFFEGPLMTAYGAQFGAAQGTATAAGPNLPISLITYCHPTLLCTELVICRPSPYYPCGASHYVVCQTPACTIESVAACHLTLNCPVASPNCPPPGPGTPVQGGGTPVQGQAAGFAPAGAMPEAIPSLVCSYAAGCWYSWGACPTQGGCGGPIHHPTKLAAEMIGRPFPGVGIGIMSRNAYCTYYCGSYGGGGCTVGAICGQHTGAYCWT
jgi:hypothetical protein